MGIIGIVVTVIAAAVTIIASILGGMQWLMNKAKKSGANEHRLTNMEDTIQALECKKNYAELAAVSTRVEVVDRSLSDHKTAIDDFNKKMTEILESVSYIKGVIDIRPLLKETELVQSNSPIALSDLGKNCKANSANRTHREKLDCNTKGT